MFWLIKIRLDHFDAFKIKKKFCSTLKTLIFLTPWPLRPSPQLTNFSFFSVLQIYVIKIFALFFFNERHHLNNEDWWNLIPFKSNAENESVRIPFNKENSNWIEFLLRTIFQQMVLFIKKLIFTRTIIVRTN